jgi:hypothetical protein
VYGGGLGGDGGGEDGGGPDEGAGDEGGGGDEDWAIVWAKINPNRRTRADSPNLPIFWVRKFLVVCKKTALVVGGENLVDFKNQFSPIMRRP